MGRVQTRFIPSMDFLPAPSPPLRLMRGEKLSPKPPRRNTRPWIGCASSDHDGAETPAFRHGEERRLASFLAPYMKAG